jgi:hypothetical protein
MKWGKSAGTPHATSREVLRKEETLILSGYDNHLHEGVGERVVEVFLLSMGIFVVLLHARLKFFLPFFFLSIYILFVRYN